MGALHCSVSESLHLNPRVSVSLFLLFSFLAFLSVSPASSICVSASFCLSGSPSVPTSRCIFASRRFFVTVYLPDSHLSLPLPGLPPSSPSPLKNTCPVGREVDHHTHDWASTDVELPQAAFSWSMHLGEALRPSCPRTCPVVLPPWDETWFSLDTHRCLSKPRVKGAVHSAPRPSLYPCKGECPQPMPTVPNQKRR